jgi:hypothetical protein
LLERGNVAGDQSLVVPAEYLEAVITKRHQESYPRHSASAE